MCVPESVTAEACRRAVPCCSYLCTPSPLCRRTASESVTGCRTDACEGVGGVDARDMGTMVETTELVSHFISIRRSLGLIYVAMAQQTNPSQLTGLSRQPIELKQKRVRHSVFGGATVFPIVATCMSSNVVLYDWTCFN